MLYDCCCCNYHFFICLLWLLHSLPITSSLNLSRNLNLHYTLSIRIYFVEICEVQTLADGSQAFNTSVPGEVIEHETGRAAVLHATFGSYCVVASSVHHDIWSLLYGEFSKFERATGSHSITTGIQVRIIWAAQYISPL
ncbi:hypothetical protein EV426DRAFT_314978 [Tirmania nivea]|nr:hypothetical protein EV426DRAFT_314978 [Tirmania nivea]